MAKGRKNDTAAGRRVGNGSRDRSYHITVQEQYPDCLVVSMNLTEGAPTIHATVSGLHRVFIIDTVSSISIIQPGVCYSEVRPTRLSPFGVTGNELEIKGVQEVEFYLNNRNFVTSFVFAHFQLTQMELWEWIFFRGRRQI